MAVIATKRWTQPDGTYLEIELYSDGGVCFEITDPYGGPDSRGDTSCFDLDGNQVDELREELS